MTTMAILCKYDYGTFFEPILLEHIELGNQTEILSILQDVNPSQLSDNCGRMLLHFAAEYGNSEFARYLIDLGADVDAQTRWNYTPLMLAVQYLHEETVRLLLEANADMFLPDLHGYCALGKAFSDTRRNNVNIINALTDKITVESLNKSVYVNSEAFHSDCSLFHFMRLKDVEITRILLKKGSPINAIDPILKETALHGAVILSDLENIKLLLEWNADVNAKGHAGKTPLARVLRIPDESKALEVMKILISAGATLIDYDCRVNMVHSLLSSGSRKIVRAVLEFGINLFFMDREGMTSLHYLAKNPRLDILRELAHLDFDVNVRCSQRFTMLHFAAAAGNASSVKFLLDLGADINAKDWYHRTPLYTATDAECLTQLYRRDPDRLNNCLNCVEILLERGADPQIFTRKNRGWLLQRNLSISDEIIKIITPLLATLALHEVYGRPIKAYMRVHIDSFPQLKSTFNFIKLEIAEMKQIEIDDSVTLFDFLTIDENEVWRFARNRRFVSNLTNIMKEYSMTSHYHRMLCKRFLKFNQFVEWREAMIQVFNEIFDELYNILVSDISEKIVDCLQHDKWREIL